MSNTAHPRWRSGRSRHPYPRHKRVWDRRDRRRTRRDGRREALAELAAVDLAWWDDLLFLGEDHPWHRRPVAPVHVDPPVRVPLDGQLRRALLP